MRGHIGFKIRRQPTPTLRITALRAAVLVSEIPAPTLRITALRASILTIPEPSEPEAPVGLVAYSDELGAINLLFAPVVDNGDAIIEYTVEYSTNEITWTTLTFSAATVDGWSVGYPGFKRIVVTGLSLGTEYAFRVAATNTIGTGPFNTVLAYAIPATGIPFTASIIHTLDYAAWSANGMLGSYQTLFGRGVFVYTMNQTTADYDFPVYRTFRADTSGGTPEDSLCSNSRDGSLCLYDYQYQIQENTTGYPAVSEWRNVSTNDLQLGEAIFLSETPRRLVFLIQGFNGSPGTITSETPYFLRCVVRRKSDDAFAISNVLNWMITG